MDGVCIGGAELSPARLLQRIVTAIVSSVVDEALRLELRRTVGHFRSSVVLGTRPGY